MDLSHLLPPISIPDVCGPDPKADNLNLEKEWRTYEENADAQSWSQSEYLLQLQKAPDSNRAAPSWNPLQAEIIDLAGKTKHLQLAVDLVKCLAYTEGLPGLRDGLQLLRAWSMTWWDYMHPGAVDKEDLESRPEIVAELATDVTINRFKRIPLVEVSVMRGSKKTVMAGPYNALDFETDSKRPERVV